jgi:hypothetical protein
VNEVPKATESEEDDEPPVALELAHTQEKLEMAESKEKWQEEVVKLLRKLNADEAVATKEKRRFRAAMREFGKAIAHPLVFAAAMAPLVSYCTNRSLHAYQAREAEFRVIQDQRTKRFADQQASLSSFGDAFPRSFNLLEQVVDNALWCDFHQPKQGTEKDEAAARTSAEEYRQRYETLLSLNEKFLTGKNPTSLVAQVGAIFDSSNVTAAATDLRSTIRELQNVRDPGNDGYDTRRAKLMELHERGNGLYLKLLDAMGDELKQKASGTPLEAKR